LIAVHCMGGTLRCVGGRSCSYTYRGRPVTYWRQSTAAAKLSQSPITEVHGRPVGRTKRCAEHPRYPRVQNLNNCATPTVYPGYPRIQNLTHPQPSHNADNLPLIPSQLKPSFPTHNTFPTCPPPAQTPDSPQTCPAYTSHTYPHHKTPTAAHDHSQ
jgi:hypothetical protein